MNGSEQAFLAIEAAKFICEKSKNKTEAREFIEKYIPIVLASLPSLKSYQEMAE